MSPPLQVFYQRRAERDASRISAWWRANRNAAPDLFIDELEQTIRTIADAPLLGAVINREDLLSTRRKLMPRTQFFVYYRVDGEDLLILAIWHAARGRQPRVR